MIFIEYNTEEYNQNKKQKISLVFIDTIPDMVISEKPIPIVLGLFISGRKFKYLSCFYYTILFCRSQNITLSSALCFVMKIQNKRELGQIVLNHSSDFDFQDFMNLYRTTLVNHIY